VFDLTRVVRWQKQKKAAVLAFTAASCSLLLCSLILFVPSLDDALSGQPEYLRWITDRTARAVAARTSSCPLVFDEPAQKLLSISFTK
jgi:hypothetical protein